MKSFLIFLLLVVVNWTLSAASSEKDILLADPRLKFCVYQFDPDSFATEVKQTEGTLKIPDGKNIGIALKKLNKANLNTYIPVINKITVMKKDAYIAIPFTALNLLPELGRRCPAIKNLIIEVCVDVGEMPNLSNFKKLLRLRLLVGLRKQHKIIKNKELLLYQVTSKEQEYLNGVISYVGRIKTVKELTISGRYYDIDLSTYNKQQHIESLTINAGKITLPNNIGTVKTLIMSCMDMVGFPKQLETLNNLSKFKFTFSSMPPVLSLPKMKKLEYLDLSWNNFSCIKFDAMPMLNTLKLGNCQKLSKITGLAKMKSLQVLELHSPGFEDTSVLGDLHNLKTLNLSSCKKLGSLEFLSQTPLLQDLNLAGCNIKDITAISQLPNLETLNLAGNNIDNYSCLLKLANLKTLYIGQNDADKVRDKYKPNFKIIPVWHDSLLDLL